MIMKRGFTLIELLIVVAIIAILAAIAIPNFLEAQIRSKVSRAHADMRSIANGLESYHVDRNKYPPSCANGAFIPPEDRMIPLTTPVAYMTSIPQDVFRIAARLPNPERYYSYLDCKSYFREIYDMNVPSMMSPGEAGGRRWWWWLFSIGPDLTENYCVPFYDPTNGTVSSGDIVRFGP